jgi:general secretion pathway protein H
MAKKVVASLARISRQTTKSILKSSQGLTLLEIVIVVAMIAFMATLAIPKLGGQKAKIQATVRKLAIVSRDIKYRAKLQNATYRLAIQMAPPESENEEGLKHQFWVEKAPGSVVPDRDEETEEKEEDENAPPDPKAFARDTQIMKEPEELPRGMTFSRVEFSGLDAPIESGVAYIYYLPEGFVNESAIHIEYEEKLKWTVAIQPLTGKADIFDKDVPLRELRQ